jgi:hypothetical protein
MLDAQNWKNRSYLCQSIYVNNPRNIVIYGKGNLAPPARIEMASPGQLLQASLQKFHVTDQNPQVQGFVRLRLASPSPAPPLPIPLHPHIPRIPQSVAEVE